MPRPVQIVLALLVLQAALVLLFVAPGRTRAARAPGRRRRPAAAAPVERALAARGDAFEVHTYADAAAARTAIREREVYGAVVPSEGRVLVASAASPVVAQLLRERSGTAHVRRTWCRSRPATGAARRSTCSSCR